jgi:hypothetical protein
MTTWKARRVGDRILCGRPELSRGYCSELIATVVTTASGHVTCALPGGLKQEPRGSNVWVPKARPKPGSHIIARGAQVGRHQHPGANRERIREDLLDPPFKRPCPVCNGLAEVTPDLLE